MKNIKVYLDLLNRGALIECDTTEGWVPITDPEHLKQVIASDCIVRVKPSGSVSVADIALALSRR